MGVKRRGACPPPKRRQRDKNATKGGRTTYTCTYRKTGLFTGRVEAGQVGSGRAKGWPDSIFESLELPDPTSAIRNNPDATRGSYTPSASPTLLTQTSNDRTIAGMHIFNIFHTWLPARLSTACNLSGGIVSSPVARLPDPDRHTYTNSDASLLYRYRSRDTALVISLSRYPIRIHPLTRSSHASESWLIPIPKIISRPARGTMPRIQRRERGSVFASALHASIPTKPETQKAGSSGRRKRGTRERGGGAYSFVVRLGYFPIDHAPLRDEVPFLFLTKTLPTVGR